MKTLLQVGVLGVELVVLRQYSGFVSPTEINIELEFCDKTPGLSSVDQLL